MSPELVLLCHMLQPSKHLGSSPWNFHQYDNDFHSVKSKTGHGTPDAVSRAEGWRGVRHENHLPPPAGYTLANTAIGCPHRLWSPYPWSYLKTQMDVVLEDLLQVTPCRTWTRQPPEVRHSMRQARTQLPIFAARAHS